MNGIRGVPLAIENGAAGAGNDQQIVNNRNVRPRLDRLVPIVNCRVNYRGIVVQVFAYSEVGHPRQYFFTPAVLLDVNSIINGSDDTQLNRDFVRFTIHMWNENLRMKVRDRLQSLPGHSLTVELDDISVMPYEVVQLLAKPDSMIQYIQLLDQTKSYCQLNEKFDFFLTCNSQETALSLAQNFRRNPGYNLNSWELSLECRGLLLTGPAGLYSTKFPVTSVGEARNLALNWNGGTVPVFSVLNCPNPQSRLEQFLTFSTFGFDTKIEHGDFNLRTGLFTVQTEGKYQFHFNAHIKTGRESRSHIFILKVDEQAECVAYSNWISEAKGFSPVALTALLPLKRGQKVGIMFTSGQLFESTIPGYSSRFFGILLAD